MVLTDVATGWTECVPVVVRNGALVIEALVAARRLFPFSLRGVDFDNDGAFMNEAVVDWYRDQRLEVTRSRAYRKNDQAWVEQTNGAIAAPCRLRVLRGRRASTTRFPRRCGPAGHGPAPLP